MGADSLLQRLRVAGIRLSVARIGVMQVLQAAEPQPLGVEDVYRRMGQRGTRASLGTVYRAMNELEAHGLLLREWSHHRKALYRIKPAGFDGHLLRLVCRDCERSVAVTDAALLAELERQARAQGLALAGSAVTIACECQRCGAAGDEDARAPAPCPCPLARRRAWPVAANSG
ncbi:MAG: Ferric uptake regulation protein [Luteibacter sp.]|nr:MAG: Ferric uptake regulation protein [Luteibacter sp.]